MTSDLTALKRVGAGKCVIYAIVSSVDAARILKTTKRTLKPSVVFSLYILIICGSWKKIDSKKLVHPHSVPMKSG